MTYGVLDCETTTFQKGNPFSARNRLCVVGCRIGEVDECIPIQYDPTAPYAEALVRLDYLIGSVDTLVLFNAKFDLNWLARYGIVVPDRVAIFDCQLAEFILDNQRTPYPSLDGCLAKRGMLGKSSSVVHEYWGAGLDTDQIPYEDLQAYLCGDLERTDALYQRLLSECVADPSRDALIKLHMQDLRVLQEMEFNGELFAWDSLTDASAKAERELDEIQNRIKDFVPEAVRTHFNVDSGDHLSILLYGGSVSVKTGTPYQRTYKSGPRAGEDYIAHKWETREHTFPQLVKPPKGSELKKKGFYSTDEETLLSLPKPKALIELLLRRAELAKLVGTYFRGIRKLCEKYDWLDGYVHGTLNQCRVITGRLSSEKPNEQNFPEVMNEYIISRFNS